MFTNPFDSASGALQVIEHVDRCGGDYQDWYVSMAPDPDYIMFTYHLVDPQGQYVYLRMNTYHEARFLVEHLVNVYRMKTGPVFGGADALYVYAFKTGLTTRE
ncbi:MAG TPA: hypothetical protein VL500_03760 [Candidatus Eisenbacteria bacterium]|nr:hypothetical protein [Candidatus Eisenbacteria bacterium]